MSAPNEVDSSSHSQLVSEIFDKLLDSFIVDVASEYHRVAHLGLDRNWEHEEKEIRLSAEALAKLADPSNINETNAKYVVDIFGQTHPAVASDIFDCMNCGRSIVAGRFAPHLEKCMGKGRKASMKTTRSSRVAQNRHTRGSTSSNSPYSPLTNINRLSNGSYGIEEYSNGNPEEP